VDALGVKSEFDGSSGKTMITIPRTDPSRPLAVVLSVDTFWTLTVQPGTDAEAFRRIVLGRQEFPRVERVQGHPYAQPAVLGHAPHASEPLRRGRP
jgi:hypothetical protein